MNNVTVSAMNLQKHHSCTSTHKGFFLLQLILNVIFFSSKQSNNHSNLLLFLVDSLSNNLRGKEGRYIHTKTLNRGNSDWSGCRRSTRKQTVPDRPSNRLHMLVTESEPVLNSSVKMNSANLRAGKNTDGTYCNTDSIAKRVETHKSPESERFTTLHFWSEFVCLQPPASPLSSTSQGQEN